MTEVKEQSNTCTLLKVILDSDRKSGSFPRNVNPYDLILELRWYIVDVRELKVSDLQD